MLQNFPLISIIDPLLIISTILRTVTRSWYFAVIGREALLLVSLFLARLRRKSDEKNNLEVVVICGGYDLKKAYSK